MYRKSTSTGHFFPILLLQHHPTSAQISPRRKPPAGFQCSAGRASEEGRSQGLNIRPLPLPSALSVPRDRAVIFDFDGVIANSEPLHLAHSRVLAAEGVALSERDYYERYLGFDDIGVFRGVGEARGLSGTAPMWRGSSSARRSGSKCSNTTVRSSSRAPSRRSGASLPRCRSRLPRAPCGGDSARPRPRRPGASLRRRRRRRRRRHQSSRRPDRSFRAVDLLSAAIGLRLTPRPIVAVEDLFIGASIRPGPPGFEPLPSPTPIRRAPRRSAIC